MVKKVVFAFDKKMIQAFDERKMKARIFVLLPCSFTRPSKFALIGSEIPAQSK
jgi:hypothetical protein